MIATEQLRGVIASLERLPNNLSELAHLVASLELLESVVTAETWAPDYHKCWTVLEELYAAGVDGKPVLDGNHELVSAIAQLRSLLASVNHVPKE